MYSRILKVATLPKEEACYELSQSNPSHLSEIYGHIKTAVDYMAELPSGDIELDLTNCNPKLEAEAERYITFSGMLDGFHSLVMNVDASLSATIKQTIDDNYASKNMEEIKAFITNYSTNELLVGFATLQAYGLTDNQIADFLAMSEMFTDMQKMTEQERLDYLKEILNNSELPEDSLFKQVATELYNLYFESPEKFGLAIAEELADSPMIEQYIVAALPTMSLPERNALLSHIDAATARYNRLYNKVTAPGNHNHSAWQRYFNARKDLQENQALLQSLNSLDDAALKNANFIVGGAVILISLTVEGVGAYNAGLRGEDIAEKMFSGLVGIGAEAGFGAMTSAVLVGLFNVSTVVAGPIAGGAIFVVGMIYEIWFRPSVEKWIEEQYDEAEQQSWGSLAWEEMLSDNRLDYWDVNVIKTLPQAFSEKPKEIA